jgi:D-arabinose 1-dehydrogenase-like Zn-dependent alcohol dehydrogenase
MSPRPLRPPPSPSHNAQVTAIARQEDKAKEAKELGADAFVTLDEALDKRKNFFDIVLNTASGAVDNAKASMSGGGAGARMSGGGWGAARRPRAGAVAPRATSLAPAFGRV